MPPPGPSPNVIPSPSSVKMDSYTKASSLPAPPPPAVASDASLMVEVCKNRLYFASFAKPPAPSPGVHYFSTDRSLIYWNFFLDFGPMNLGQTYRFCEMVEERLAMYPHDRVVYYSSNHGQRRANSIMLMCAYSMLVRGLSADEAFKPFAGIQVPAFHDATPCVCSYELTVLDCLRGMDKARKLGFLNFATFNVLEYEHFEKVESGDLSWIFPGRFVAFAGPHDTKSYDEQYPTCVPEDYVPHFQEKNVGLVIRLNKKYYEESRFKSSGIDHMDLYYPDGSCPSDDILDRFLQICESRPVDQAIAVHCKAGLGRTGTCIGAYAMKHWGFTAAEVIGWMRVARPGSVIGPQQQYMEAIQERMHRAGRGEPPVRKSARSPHGSTLGVKVSPVANQQQNDNDDEKTQGDFLINAKVHSPHAPAVRKGLATNNTDIVSVEFAVADTTTISSNQGGTTTTTSSAMFALRGVARKLYGVGK